MDQVKIGKFIAACRKKENLTQLQLAEKLNITDRAVSKWETGKCLPDSAIMLDLCDVLKISVNDLLCGEVVTMENYNKEMENKLLEMVKEKERADKNLLALEIFGGLHILDLGCIKHQSEFTLDLHPFAPLDHAVFAVYRNVNVVLVTVVVTEELDRHVFVEILFIFSRRGSLSFLRALFFTAKTGVLRFKLGEPELVFPFQGSYVFFVS
jgi:transcriptional regulator with XRE-family HTH domain